MAAEVKKEIQLEIAMGAASSGCDLTTHSLPLPFRGNGRRKLSSGSWIMSLEKTNEGRAGMGHSLFC
jgi:hypothetical protein